MSSFLLALSVIILCVLDYDVYTMANIIDCKLSECHNTIINCSPREDCSILCTETQSCSGSFINCPLFGDCSIKCTGPHSCKYTTINATLSNGNFNLFCQHSTDHCKRIKIYASILDTNINNNFNVSCSGPLKSCTNSEIHCPMDGNCFVSCNADTSCKWSQIIGPNNGNLTINCNGSHSCSESIFNGVQSTNIDIIGCNNPQSCYDLSLYCPPNTNGHKHCHFAGNDNNAINLYAMNGWDDINIHKNNNNINTYMHHDGTMYCGNNYDISCDIASNSWSCINSSDYCNFDYDNINSSEHLTTSIDNINYIDTHSISTSKQDNNSSWIHIAWSPFGARILFGVSVIIIIIMFGCCYSYCNNNTKKHPKHHKKNKSKIIQMNRVKSESNPNTTDNEYTTTTSYINNINDLNNTISITPRDTRDTEVTNNDTADYRKHTKARRSIDWTCYFQTNEDSTTNDEGYQSEYEQQQLQQKHNINIHKKPQIQNNYQNYIIEETETKIYNNNNNNNNNNEQYINDEINSDENEDENDFKEIAISKMSFVSRIRGNSQSKSTEYCPISQIEEESDTVKIIKSPNNYNYNYIIPQIEEESDTIISSESYTESIEESDHKTLITACTNRTVSTLEGIKGDSDDETLCQSFVLPSAC